LQFKQIKVWVLSGLLQIVIFFVGIAGNVPENSAPFREESIFISVIHIISSSLLQGLDNSHLNVKYVVVALLE
jgi:hypothetical protein